MNYCFWVVVLAKSRKNQDVRNIGKRQTAAIARQRRIFAAKLFENENSGVQPGS